MKSPHVIVIGAGMGGLSAAADLAARGVKVSVFERASKPGGKMRQVQVNGQGIDAGPTVFTMRWIFDGLFAAAGAKVEDLLNLVPATTLARHGWMDGSALDLFADLDASAAAIERFSDASNAQGYRDFCARSKRVFDALKSTFIAAQRPSAAALTMRMGVAGLPVMLNTPPTLTLWKSLAQHFSDPRLRQLFGRYSTYCGSSPMLSPATLMLVAHVEQDGVWQVEGGMIEVARAMQSLGERHGAQFAFDQHVAAIRTHRGATCGITLADGTKIDADAVVFNGDISALANGQLGTDVQRSVAGVAARQRSLSAITWCTRAKPSGFDLVHHNVFFGADYKDEFASVFEQRDISTTPTVYLCAQDRGAGNTPDGAERMLLLVNAPADGDTNAFDDAYVARIEQRAREVMQRCGLQLEQAHSEATTPAGFDALFPGSGGALYGRATHGPFATFERPAATTKTRGLFVAGGSAHPGPGIPMATMSGRLAAECVAAHLRLD
ncbi:MAG: 1-hydroxycarotenoid 3,4-desaturase CrtD [Gammaproteobacteria bacterium]